MSHLDQKTPGCAKAVLKQESGEKEESLYKCCSGFGDGPQERFGIKLYADFFAAILKGPNSVTTPKKFKAICSEAAL